MLDKLKKDSPEARSDLSVLGNNKEVAVLKQLLTILCELATLYYTHIVNFCISCHGVFWL